MNLKTFDRNNEWWLWVCTHAPLAYVRDLALDMDAMERIAANRKKEIETREKSNEHLSEVSSSLNEKLNRAIADGDKVASMLSAIAQWANVVTPEGDWGAIQNRMYSIQKILQGKDPFPPLVVDASKLDIADLEKGFGKRQRMVPPRLMNLEDITRMDPKVLEDAQPQPMVPPKREDPNGLLIGGADGGKEQVFCTKERYDELIEAESNNEYLTRTLERREAALKNCHDSLSCKDADWNILAKKHEKLTRKLEVRDVELAEAKFERDSLRKELDHTQEMLTISRQSLEVIQKEDPPGSPARDSVSAALTEINSRQWFFDECKND